MSGLTRFLWKEAELVYGSKERPDRPKMQDDSDGYVDMMSEGRPSVRMESTLTAVGSARAARRNKFGSGSLFRCAIVALLAAVLGDPAQSFTFGNTVRFETVVLVPGLVDTLDNSESVEQCSKLEGRSGRSDSDDYRVCDDGTVSYVQPDGLPYQKTPGGDRYLDIGVCGPTALANLFCMQCKLCEGAIKWLALTGLRVGGGTTGGDLWSALQSDKMSDKRKDSACPKNGGYNWLLGGSTWLSELRGKKPTLKNLEYLVLEWKIQDYRASPSNLRPWNFNPVLVFLDDHTGKAGHVTTVVRVDVSAQTVVHNTWGRQYVTGWDDFERLWFHGDYRVIYLLEPKI